MDWPKFMEETDKQIGALGKQAPGMMKGFGEMGKAAKREGAVPEKTKEFVALGIAISTRCESCIGYHMRSLVRLGATREEVCEVLEMIGYMGAGPAITYGAKALEAFDQFAALAAE